MKTIGIVGHIDNIERVQAVLEKHFTNIHGQAIEIHEMSQVKTIVTYLKEHIHNYDGILFTGKALYDIINSNIHSQNPWVYLENDESQLQRILLEISLKHQKDISQISIDSYTEDELKKIYSGFGLNPEDYLVYTAPMNVFNESFMQDLYNFHSANWKKHPNLIAITGISTVFKMLQDTHIPSQLLTPNETAITNKLHDLLEKIRIEDMIVSQIVVMAIEIDMASEYDFIDENEYHLMLEKTKVTEEVYKFAQRIQAAVVETEKNYLLFTTRKILEFETKNLRELSILSSIKKKSSNSLSIGIGFGITAREAKANALLGKNKAVKMGGDQCFVVFDKKNIEKITPTDKAKGQNISALDLSFKEISDKSHVSMNNLYRLKSIMDMYKKDTFTSFELSGEFGNSLRSMNRIIEKLEQAGYVEVIGKKIIGTAGRPSRILKLLL